MRVSIVGMMMALLCTAEAQKPSPPFLFPVDGKGKTGVTRFEAEWYSKQLRAMKEESLQPLSQDKGAEVYRFTLLPTFRHPQSIRLTKKGEAYEITLRQADGRGGYDPGKLSIDLSGKLDGAKVEEFKKLFKETSFFGQSTSLDDEGNDGSQWILEAVAEGEYHVLNRWSPEPDEKNTDLKAFVAVCDWLQKNAPEDEVAKERIRKAKEQVTEEEKSLDAFGHEWPDRGLVELGETILSPLAQDASTEVYRLVVKPSFNSPMVVTLVKGSDNWRIIHRGSDASPQMDPSNLSVDIPAEKVAEFRKLFDATSFLKMGLWRKSQLDLMGKIGFWKRSEMASIMESFVGLPIPVRIKEGLPIFLRAASG